MGERSAPPPQLRPLVAPVEVVVDAAGPVPLEVRIMGDVVVAVRGRPVVHFESATTRALLCRLAVDVGHPIRRDELAELLWPGRPAGAALGNLRHALAALHHTLGDRHGEQPLVDAVADSLVLVAEWTWVDLGEFRHLVRYGDPACRETWARAHALRRGPLLSGLDAKLSPEWGQWVAGLRMRVEQEAALVLDRLTALCAERNPPSEVIPLVREWIELDRWNERAHARLVRLLALDGHTVAALEHAEHFAVRLSSQSGIRPGPDLRAAIDDIRAGRATSATD